LLSVQYTSGTTGPPKGCLLTHEYWVSIARQAEANRPGMRTDDVLLTAQPFSYIDPQWHLVATLLLGCRLVLLDAFHPSTFLRSVRRHRVTVFYCLGAMPVLLLRRPPDAEDNRSALRFVLCSGIPAPEHAELERRFGAPWFELYGSTEIGGAAIGVTEADHDNCVGTGTLGRPLAGFEVGIVDPAGDRIKAADAAGELVVRGATGMLGYWRADGVVVDPRQDGWFRTGDLVRRTADGRYSFEGRCKDVVRRAGENISAAEVEQVLSEHPAVDLVAVVAAADELRGEEVHAVVQARRRVDPEELARFCAERIARFKVPRYWSFRELPLTPSGKVAKDALRTSLGAPDHDRAAALVRVDG
jgi:crotonobetaine/carnitine-CoA ligase